LIYNTVNVYCEFRPKLYNKSNFKYNMTALEKHNEPHYVYVVITDVDYEGSRLETVKSSKEKAEDWINENLDNSCSNISIEQWEIDGDIEKATDSWDYSHGEEF